MHVTTEATRSHALITVVRLASASITSAPLQPSISDYDASRAFEFPVSAKDSSGVSLSPSLPDSAVQHQLRLDCTASGDAAAFVELSPHTDIKTGQLSCRARISKISSSNAAQLDLSISAVVKDATGRDVVSDAVYNTHVYKGLQVSHRCW